MPPTVREDRVDVSPLIPVLLLCSRSLSLAVALANVVVTMSTIDDLLWQNNSDDALLHVTGRHLAGVVAVYMIIKQLELFSIA